LDSWWCRGDPATPCNAVMVADRSVSVRSLATRLRLVRLLGLTQDRRLSNKPAFHLQAAAPPTQRRLTIAGRVNRLHLCLIPNAGIEFTTPAIPTRSPSSWPPRHLHAGDDGHHTECRREPCIARGHDPTRQVASMHSLAFARLFGPRQRKPDAGLVTRKCRTSNSRLRRAVSIC
jgi:hypothetical protein